MEALISNDVDIVDMEQDNGHTLIYGNPTDLFKIKEAISSVKNDIEFDVDEISMLPKERITLSGEDLESFNNSNKFYFCSLLFLYGKYSRTSKSLRAFCFSNAFLSSTDTAPPSSFRFLLKYPGSFCVFSSIFLLNSDP